MVNDSCAHVRRSVSELVAKTSRLNHRVSRMRALVCDDCGTVLITDSVQPFNQIIKLIESLEKRVTAIERAREVDREADHYRIAA